MRYEIPKSIIEKAIEKFKATGQLTKTIEELSELIQAIAKHLNHPSDLQRAEIQCELADVYNMLEQLEYILDIKESDVNLIRAQKIERFYQDHLNG